LIGIQLDHQALINAKNHAQVPWTPLDLARAQPDKDSGIISHLFLDMNHMHLLINWSTVMCPFCIRAIAGTLEPWSCVEDGLHGNVLRQKGQRGAYEPGSPGHRSSGECPGHGGGAMATVTSIVNL